LYQQERFEEVRMSPTRRILTLTALAAAAACSNSATDLGDIPDDQEFLFEVEYVNYAWTFIWKGFHVDRDGGVRSYQLGTPWPHAGDASFSPETLNEKYAEAPESVSTVALDELGRRVASIPAAAAGPLADPVQRCADAGTVTFTAWIFDSGTKRYQPVLLRMNGDVARENRATAANELYAWLATLVPGFGLGGCEP
jgi:hypothetical protein